MNWKELSEIMERNGISQSELGRLVGKSRQSITGYKAADHVPELVEFKIRVMDERGGLKKETEVK